MQNGSVCSYSLPLRLYALAVGVSCHAIFLLAVGSMLLGINSGLTNGFTKLTGAKAFDLDVLLVLQFPLLHSWLLTTRGNTLLRKLAPQAIAADMTTTWFALIASLQILATFCCWSPSGIMLFRFEGVWWIISVVLYAASWAFLLQAMYDADIALQSGLKGWLAVFRNRKPTYEDFPQHRTFAVCRQPIYVAFALILWTAPVWTLDRLFFASAWTLYCIAGPLRKEARCIRYYGDRFRQYQKKVPYFVPIDGMQSCWRKFRHYSRLQPK